MTRSCSKPDSTKRCSRAGSRRYWEIWPTGRFWPSSPSSATPRRRIVCPATSRASSRERSSECRKAREAARRCASLRRSFAGLGRSPTERAISRRRACRPRSCPGRLAPASPDGRPQAIDRPLTPLLDTTVFTNAPGEPRLVTSFAPRCHRQTRSTSSWRSCAGAAYVRSSTCSGGTARRQAVTSPDDDLHEQHGAAGARRARVAWRGDQGLLRHVSTRLHAKAWFFHRESGYSTAYIGSSNLTHSAQVIGLEWNVRVAAVRNPDAVAKMAAVFTSYWESRDFAPYDPEEFSGAHRRPPATTSRCSARSSSSCGRSRRRCSNNHPRSSPGPPPQPAGRGHRHGQDRDGGRRLRAVAKESLASRLLFVAHREEILDQSRATFRHALATQPSARSGSAASAPTGSSTSSRRSRACTAPTPARRPDATSTS